MPLAARILRRIGVRLARGTLRRRRFILFCAVVIAAWVAASGFNVFSLTAHAPTYEAPYRPTAEQEPSATAAYLRGQQTYDADLIWGSYSERTQRDLERRSGGLEATKSALKRAEDAGVRLKDIQYVGGYPLPSGSLHFYVVTQSIASSRDLGYAHYTFTLDLAGRIEDVERSGVWTDPQPRVQTS